MRTDPPTDNSVGTVAAKLTSQPARDSSYECWELHDNNVFTESRETAADWNSKEKVICNVRRVITTWSDIELPKFRREGEGRDKANKYWPPSLRDQSEQIRNLNKECPCSHTQIDSRSRNLTRSSRWREGRTGARKARECNHILTSPNATTSLA